MIIILNTFQFGFRKKKSTEHAIIKLLDKVSNSLANKDPAVVIFMDLSKAFDTIDYDILFYKLHDYGLRGVVLSWLKSYLQNRQQFVFINNMSSSMRAHSIRGTPRFNTAASIIFKYKCSPPLFG